MRIKKFLLSAAVWGVLMSSIANFCFSAEEGVKGSDYKTEVILLVDQNKGKMQAFSGPKNHWVTQSLVFNEKIIFSEARDNVAIALTNDHIYGFSVLTGKWASQKISMSGTGLGDPFKVLIQGNVATVNLPKEERTFGFSAHAGTWVEAEK